MGPWLKAGVTNTIEVSDALFAGHSSLMSQIPLDKIGKIVAGSEVGRFVKIADDSESTGGFLILTSDRPDFRRGFDNWVEDEDALQRSFHEAGWLIEWIE